MFGNKETGSSETDPEEEGSEEYTDKTKRKRRKQKKIGEDLWSFVLRTSATQVYRDRLLVQADFLIPFFFLSFVFSILEIQKLIAPCLYHFARYLHIYHTIKPYNNDFRFSVKVIRGN